TTSEIQPAVLSALQSRFGEDSRLANPGEPFDATCLVSGKPSRRLVLAGHYEARWFVAYEVGGFLHYLVLAVFDAEPQPPQPVLLAQASAGKHDDRHGWRASLEDLRKALKKGRMALADPHDNSY